MSYVLKKCILPLRFACEGLGMVLWNINDGISILIGSKFIGRTQNGVNQQAVLSSSTSMQLPITTKNRNGLGVVAWDDKGCILLAAAKSQWPMVSTEMAKIMAVDWAIRLATEHHWTNIIVEGNAALVIEAFKKNRRRGLHAQVLSDSSLLMVNDFVNCSFSFCFRECNNVAHNLARWASNHSCNNVWADSNSIWIKDDVILDILP
ncbi:unnamed protein product [Amaranthus hypochondriacus]